MTKMKSIFFSAILVISTLASPGLSALQAPEPATVQGTVVQTGTAIPIPRARVILTPSTTGVDGTIFTVTTDDEGHFTLPNIPPGSYRLLATHDGFVTATYAPSKSNAGLALTPKQSLKNVVLSMMATGSISGRVKNSLGEPVGNVTVQAQKLVYQPGGKRGLNLVLTARTDDLGDYRLYYLEPGQYLVSVTPSAGPIPGQNGEIRTDSLTTIPGSPLAGKANLGRTITASDLAALGIVSAASTDEFFSSEYFPGTSDPSMAAPIDLRSGASFDNADFIVTGARQVGIRGHVVNGITAEPVQDVSVVLIPKIAGNAPASTVSATVSDSGAFEFRGVAPGPYELIATLGDLPTLRATRGATTGGAFLANGSIFLASLPAAPGIRTPARSRVVAKSAIDVGSKDLTNITLSLGLGYDISGKITVEGLPNGSIEKPEGIAIQLIPEEEALKTVPLAAYVDSNGLFTITGVAPGRYTINVSNANKWPMGSYVKSVQFENVDAITPQLVIPNDPRGRLEIVIGANPGKLSVSVVNPNMGPTAGATVVLIPDIPLRQHYDLYQTATTDATGHASIAGTGFMSGSIVPGDYTAYAFESLTDDAWWDPAFLQKYDGLGKKVHINSGATQTLDLTTIPLR